LPRANGIESRVLHEQLSEGDIDLLAQNIYNEARGEATLGRLAVAQVTLARLVSRKFQHNVTKVIFAPNQFSWTHDPRILMSTMNPATFEEIQTLLMFTIGSTKPHEAVARLAVQTGLPMDTTFYKRTDWTRDNPDPSKRLSSATAEMFSKLEVVGKIGRHTFYREKSGK
jgi:spore germination cell wall hydrolase CwlJ-like protein